jgi:hypothetical protein
VADRYHVLASHYISLSGKDLSLDKQIEQKCASQSGDPGVPDRQNSCDMSL